LTGPASVVSWAVGRPSCCRCLLRHRVVGPCRRLRGQRSGGDGVRTPVRAHRQPVGRNTASWSWRKHRPC